MPVPITEIAKTIGLAIIEGHRITDDFSIFGEIYFSPGKAEVYDLFQCTTQELDFQRGTILIDAYTNWERNLGCVKNTIAHEVYHWYKHRMYAAIRYILYGKDYVACRCPSNMVYPGKDDEWIDEQRMERQANSMAPRILVPLRTFRMKVDELYKQYDYASLDWGKQSFVLAKAREYPQKELDDHEWRRRADASLSRCFQQFPV